MSLRTRLTLWYTGVLALTLLLFGTALYVFISVTTKNNIQQSLSDQGGSIIQQIQVVPLLNMNVITLPELNDFKSAGTFLQANRTDGLTTKSNNFRGNLPFDRAAGFERAQQEASWFTLYSTKEDYSLLVYHIRMEAKGQFLGVLQVATEVSGDYAFLKNLRYILLLLSVVAVGIAATLGSYLARKALRPIEHVITAASRIERGEDLGQRIGHTGPRDEIGRLTETINSMLERLEATYNDLEQAYRTQRRFVADASHELRTPLTTIRGNVDLLQKVWNDPQREERLPLSLEAMRDIAHEAERMSRLVGDLLALARADAGQRISKTDIALKPVVEEVIRKSQFITKTAEWRQGDLSALDGAVIYGNADYVQQLLIIFIDNAFKYTDEGYVQLDAVRAQGRVAIRIRDSGIGMNSEELPLIFERFYRADASRGQTAGTGLGLSIAKWIIDELGGSIEVVSRKGEGSLFVIWLPLSGGAGEFPPVAGEDMV